MNASRRLANWRLVAVLVVVSALAAADAIAQTQNARVKIGPANVYERPRTGSDVVATVQEGTILEVLKREETWYWVMLPRDVSGTQRAGYIAAYLLELIPPKGTVQPGIVAQPAPPPPSVKPAPAAAPRVPRYFLGIGGGIQSASHAFTDTVVFPLYDENGQYHARYSTPNASALDATIGMRVARHLVLAFAFWRSTTSLSATVDARVPHPFTYNAFRAATATGMSVGHMENDGHLQVTLLLPLTRRVDLSIFGGPSVFYLRQDLIDSLSFRESYPYDQVAIGGFQTERKSKAAIGGNAGVDVTVMLWRHIGLGVSGRYAGAPVKLPSAGAGSVSLRLGGAQVSGGLRMRF